MLGPFQLLFAALGFGKYAYDEIKEGNRVANQIVFEKKFYDQYTDWNLEDSYFEAMKDPNNYDALWERVERYKEEGGKMALFYEDTADTWWRNVGKERFAFLSKNGKFKSEDPYEEKLLRDRQKTMVNLLMNTHGMYSMGRALKDVFIWWPRPDWSWLDVHPSEYVQLKKKIE